MKKLEKLCVMVGIICAPSGAVAQERGKSAKMFKDAVSCNEFALPVKQSMGQAVGAEQCLILSEETVFSIKGHKFRRVELRLTGAVEGWDAVRPHRSTLPRYRQI